MKVTKSGLLRTSVVEVEDNGGNRFNLVTGSVNLKDGRQLSLSNDDRKKLGHTVQGVLQRQVLDSKPDNPIAQALVNDYYPKAPENVIKLVADDVLNGTRATSEKNGWLHTPEIKPQKINFTLETERGLIATDHRNGAPCVVNLSSLVQSYAALVGEATQYTCSPNDSKPYAVDLMYDADAAKKVYTPKNKPKSYGMEV